MAVDYVKSLKTSFETTDDKGSIVAKSSSFGNADVYGDVFAPSAFDRSIATISKDSTIPMLFNHSPDVPLGSWHTAYKQGEYLYTEGKMCLDVARSQELHSLMKGGHISGVSIGFNSNDMEEIKGNDGKASGTLFKSVDLLESSIVVFPANPLASVSEVKSITRIREFEKSLIDAARDAGVTLSRRDVEKLSQSVWPKLGKSIEREADTDDGESLLEAIAGFDPLKI